VGLEREEEGRDFVQDVVDEDEGGDALEDVEGTDSEAEARDGKERFARLQALERRAENSARGLPECLPLQLLHELRHDEALVVHLDEEDGRADEGKHTEDRKRRLRAHETDRRPPAPNGAVETEDLGQKQDSGENQVVQTQLQVECAECPGCAHQLRQPLRALCSQSEKF
jgi:hypothetical protein